MCPYFSVNAPSKEALLRSRPVSTDFYVLTFSRHSRKFREVLDDAGGLELPSGAKIFVRPEHYDPVVEQLRVDNWDLKKYHVVVSEEHEATVMRAVASLPSKEQIRRKDRVALAVPNSPSQEAAGSANDDAGVESLESDDGGSAPVVEALDSEGDEDPSMGSLPVVLVQRTFIHVPLPSSIYSGPSSGQKTASTTGTYGATGLRPARNPRNHRLLSSPESAEPEAARGDVLSVPCLEGHLDRLD